MIDSKLNDILNSYDCNDSAYVISDYIKKNMKEIPVRSIGEVAEACFVSKGQISKFVKKIGYESYFDFKVLVLSIWKRRYKRSRYFVVRLFWKKMWLRLPSNTGKCYSS